MRENAHGVYIESEPIGCKKIRARTPKSFQKFLGDIEWVVRLGKLNFAKVVLSQ